MFSGRGIDARIPGAETARRTDGEVGQGGTPGDIDVTCDEDILSFGWWVLQMHESVCL